MRCQDILKMLSSYLDGVLEPSDREAVKIHLACCPACRAEWEELTLSISLLQELPELAPPAGFRAGLMDKIDKLPAPVKAPQNKRWFERVSEVSKSKWYQTAAVAAVMAMTLGLTSLLEKDGSNQFMPVDPRPEKEIAQVGERPEKNDPINGVVNPGGEQSTDTGPTNTESPGVTPGKTVIEPVQPGKLSEPGKVDKDRGFESFVPQPSEGMVASSAALRLIVQDSNTALKSLGSITQNNGGSVYSPYSENNGSGQISIKVPLTNYKSTVNELQKLGDVDGYLPTERDLSSQHKQAKDILEQLKAKKADLESKLAQEENEEVEAQLGAVNSSVAEQVNTIKQLEDRSVYGIIIITLI